MPILIGVLLALTRPALRRSWFGAMTGVGAMSLPIAFGEHHGPGTVGWQTATAAGCDQHLNPWPWAVVGAALVVGGFVAQALRVLADREYLHTRYYGAGTETDYHVSEPSE